jgi:UDP-glucose 4-epimerase
MKYKVIVFGGSGYLGKALISKLLEEKYIVFNFDIKSSNELKHKNYHYINGDITNTKQLENAIKGKNIIYHYAGISDLDEAVDKPEETLILNVLSTLRILKIAKKNKINQFIYASSIYASSNTGGFYKSSKVSSETYIKEFSKRYGIIYTIMRFGSIYGPGGDSRNGIYKIISDAIKNNDISYKGHKDSIREYIHVYDAAISASICIQNDSYKNKTVLVTGPNRVSVKDLLNTVGELLNIQSKVKFVSSKHEGHYVRTPYSYGEAPIKIVNKNYIDLNDGILQVIDEIYEKK